MEQVDRNATPGGAEAASARRLPSSEVERVYHAYRESLYRFLRRVLRNEQLAADALHATFVKLMEAGGDVAPEKIKSWLFRVGFNAALNVRRRLAVEVRSVEAIGLWRSLSGRSTLTEIDAEQLELAERAVAAVQRLSPDQRQVIQLRIHQDLKFREIAEQLKIPLGTVLTRMRTALIALREELKQSSKPR